MSTATEKEIATAAASQKEKMKALQVTLDKMEKRVELDLYYIERMSLWLDLKIIVLTVVKGFVNRNAY